jgi:hypothetical protein
MKSSFARHFRFLALPFLALGLANPCGAQDEKIPEITTARGKTYRDVRITKVTPSEVSIAHEAGAARIPFADLPEDLKAKLGYDPEKEKDHAAAVANQEKAVAANAAKRQLLDRAYLQIVSATIVQVVDGGLYVRVDQTWDGKSYETVPEYSYSGPGSSNGNGGGIHKSRNKNAGERVKKINHSPTVRRVFISCDNSKYIDGGKFSGNVWLHGRYSFTDTTGAAATIPKYTTNPDEITGN